MPKGGAKLSEPVVFCSNRENVRFEVRSGPSELSDPMAPTHPDTKWAIFEYGFCKADDPEIVEFLDKRDDVWRQGDPTAALKTELGTEEFSRLQKEFKSLDLAPTATPDSEDENEELS